MNELENKINQCRTLLFEEPIVKEYFRLKKIVDSHPELKNLDKEIHTHQKLMCLHKENDEIYFKEKNLYEGKLHEFNSNPLVENYFQVQEEVYALLNEVKEILE